MLSSIVCLFLQLALVAWQPLSAARSALQPPADHSAAKPLPIDRVPVSSGDVIVVADDMNQALNLAGPGAVVLSAERYRALKEKEARAEKLGQPARTDALLSVCKLSGQVIRDASNRELLDLQINLEFRTQVPNAVVSIGLKGSKLTKATLDGETPTWGPDRTGLTVQVKEARVYQMSLQVQVPVTRTGAERKAFLDRLPSAAITTLDVTVPEQVRSASVKGAGAVSVNAIDGQRSRLQSDALGVLDQLELTWQTAAVGSPSADPLAALMGDLRYSVGEGMIDSDLHLRVEATQGSITALKLRLAPNTEVLRAEDEGHSELLNWEPRTPARDFTIQLKQPLTANDPPLQLRLRLQNKFTAKPGATIALGQCELLEPKPSSQLGTIAVTVAPELRGLHWQHGNMHRGDPRDLVAPESRNADVAYRYWQQPVKLEAALDPTPALPMVVETRTNQTLRFSGVTMMLTSEVEILRISRGAALEFEIRWPKGWTLIERRTLPTLPVEFDFDPNAGLVRARFSSRPATPFKFKLEGMLALAAQNGLAVALPALVHVAGDRGEKKDGASLTYREGQVRIIPDDMDVWLRKGTIGVLTEGNRLPEPDLPVVEPLTLNLEPWTPDRAWSVALGWQPRRIEVSSQAEVYLSRREMHLEQSLRYGFTGPPPQQLGFLLPDEFGGTDQLRLTYTRANGATVTRDIDWHEQLRLSDSTKREKAVALPAEAHGHATIAFVHRQLIGDKAPGEKLSIPLLQSGKGDILQGPSCVRFWTSAEIQIIRPEADAGWQASLSAPSSGGELAPTLELCATRGETPLRVAFRNVEASAAADAVADRVLVEVAGLAEERSTCRVRYWFSRLRLHALAVTLPAAAPLLQIDRVLLNGHEQPLERIETADMERTGQQIHLEIPIPAQSLARPVLLELRYQWAAPAQTGRLLSHTIPVPVLGGRIVTGSVRWRVEWPSSWLPLPQDSMTVAEQPWQWLGALWPPGPRLMSGEMEQWLLASNEALGPVDERPALSFAQFGALQPLRVVHPSRQPWLLAWSLVMLVAGLTVYCFPPRRLWLWTGLTLGGVIVAGALAPHWLTAIAFGVQPGAIVLAGTVLFLWMRQRRWRRQVVALPGFSRLKSGSSLVRSGLSPRPQREPSTVDAPAPAPSSAEAEA